MLRKVPLMLFKVVFCIIVMLIFYSPKVTFGHDSVLVDPSGALQYAYPITLPPGTNGVGPSLSLVYNSNIGNGMLGVGWALGGLPVISRDPSYGINFDANDHFIYDGQKLVYNSSDGYYHTEKESYIRIKAWNLTTSSSYWEVTLKNGTKMFFGRYDDGEHTLSNDGHIDAVGQSGKALLWSMSRVEDVYGNYYIVEYNEDTTNGDYYPYKITYTKNSGISKYRTVEFSYETRTDTCPMYVPTLYKMDQRLQWITVKMDGSLLRKYKLDYGYSNSTGRSRLTAIQEYGSDGVSTLPATNFVWQEGDNSFTVCDYCRCGPGNSHQMTGDFNGDGKTDLIYYVDDSGWRVLLSSGYGFSAYYWSGYGSGNSHQMTGDFNGDGRTDLIYYVDGQGWRVLLSTGSTFSANYWSTCGPGSSNQMIGDFNGDGKDDLVYYVDGEGWRVLLSTGSSFSVRDWSVCGQGTSNQMVGDFNGDGKKDLVYYDGEGWRVLLSTGSSFSASDWSACGQGTSNQMVGDFNGDGKIDLVYYDGEGWRVLLSTGSSFSASNWSACGQGTSNQMVGDFNGDGKIDLVYYDGEGWRVLLSTGSSFSASDWSVCGQGTSNQMVGDFNGDGKIDLVYYVETEGWRVLQSNGLVNDLMVKVSVNNQNNINVTYLPSPQVSNSVLSTNKTYPNIANSSPRPLVTNITLYNGLSGSQEQTVSTTYQYSNGVVHMGFPWERVNLGFAYLKKIDDNSQSSLITYYRQDDVDYAGLIDKLDQYGSNNQLYTETRYSYAKDPTNKFIKVTDQFVDNYNGEQGTPITYHTQYTSWDSYGNLTETINYGDTSVTSDDEKLQTDYICYVTGSDYAMVPSAVRKYATNLSGTTNTLASETRFTYDSSILKYKYAPHYKTFENGDQDKTNYFDYDAYGNLTTLTDENNNHTTMIYDSSYQTWLRYKTNALNQTTETVYDSLMRPIKTIDANNAVLETQYDVFSRETATIAPGDDQTNPTTRKTYPVSWVLPLMMKVEKKESGSNYLVSYTYSDGLGRVIQEKSESTSGWITVDHYYDNSGRNYKNSIPYITTSYANSTPDTTVKCKWVEYDPIGRESVIHNTDTNNTITTTVQMFYGKDYTLTVDENGHVVKKQVRGNTETTINYTGVYPNQAQYATTTKLTAWDGVKITDTGNNVIQTNLDMLGRKTQYSDPSMGTWTYSYNSNLFSQTDAKNQTITITYDELNRPEVKTYPDNSTVNYYYDETGHGYSKGRLTRVVYIGGSESYNYDSRGRQTSVTKTIGAISKTESMSYDAMDRINTMTYPDSEVTTFGYDASGNANSLTGTSTYVSSVNYTPFGGESQIQYGNGVQTAFDYYDTVGEYDSIAGTYYSYRLKGIQVTKSGTSLLNLSYKYDMAGNVKEKQDLNNSNLTEQYGYDALNRLTSATSSTQLYGNKTYGYDTINNIQTKDGRTYQYDSIKKYQVTNDGRYTYTYDANGNIIGRSDGRVISWDFENRVTSLSDGGNFTYDASGERIQKVENGITTLYFFGNYEEEYQGGNLTKTVKYYFINGLRVAERSSTTGLRYYHQDHLSSTTIVTDTNGNLILRTVSDPYGSNAYSQGSAVIKYKYTGQEMDGSGLYYYGARYYDPQLGRFLSPDTVLDGLNRYAYCGNNPIIYNDPTGHEFIGALIGGVFGAICGGVVALWNGATFGSSQFWTAVGIGAVAGAIIGGLYIDPSTIGFSGGLTGDCGVTASCSFQLGSSAGGLAASGVGGTLASTGAGLAYTIGEEEPNGSGLYGDLGESQTLPSYYYSQKDPLWSDTLYTILDPTDPRYPQTISSSGCGPTSAAMVITKITGVDVTPDITAKYAIDNGFRTENSGTDYAFFGAIGKEYGITVIETKSFCIVNDYLTSQNCMAVAAMGPGHFTGSGHFIVFDKSSMYNTFSMTTRVLDPNSIGNSKSWSNSILVNEAKYFWVFLR